MPLDPLRRAQYSNIALDTKIAVNIEPIMPRESVTAKPLIGPVPNW